MSFKRNTNADGARRTMDDRRRPITKAETELVTQLPRPMGTAIHSEKHNSRRCNHGGWAGVRIFAGKIFVQDYTIVNANHTGYNTI